MFRSENGVAVDKRFAKGTTVLLFSAPLNVIIKTDYYSFEF